MIKIIKNKIIIMNRCETIYKILISCGIYMPKSLINIIDKYTINVGSLKFGKSFETK
jgi:hypothetical protein